MTDKNKQKSEQIFKILKEVLSESMKPGFHGECALSVVFHDGNIQGFEKNIKQKYK